MTKFIIACVSAPRNLFEQKSRQAEPASGCCRRTEREPSRHISERLGSPNLRASPQIICRHCLRTPAGGDSAAASRSPRPPPKFVGQAEPGRQGRRPLAAGRLSLHPVAAAGQNTNSGTTGWSPRILRIRRLPSGLQVSAADSADWGHEKG